jgi:hypothetical protein
MTDYVTTTFKITRRQHLTLRSAALDIAAEHGGKPDASAVLRDVLDGSIEAQPMPEQQGERRCSVDHKDPHAALAKAVDFALRGGFAVHGKLVEWSEVNDHFTATVWGPLLAGGCDR